MLNARTGKILGDQASLIGVPVKPRYSDLQSSDSGDSMPATATVTPPVDTTTFTATATGDVRVILDTGSADVVGD